MKFLHSLSVHLCCINSFCQSCFYPQLVVLLQRQERLHRTCFCWFNELLNFIVPSSCPSNLTFSVSPDPSLSHSVSLSVLCSLALVLYCSRSSEWVLRPSGLIYVWILMILVEWMLWLCESPIIPSSVSWWIIQDCPHNSGCQTICQSSFLCHSLAVCPHIYMHVCIYILHFSIACFTSAYYFCLFSLYCFCRNTFNYVNIVKIIIGNKCRIL